MKYKIEQNTKFNSLEIYFDEIPTEEIRNNLKGLRFRWNRKKGCWYGFTDQETLEKAITGTNTTQEKTTELTDQAFKKAFSITHNEGYMGGGGYEGNKCTLDLTTQEKKKAIIQDIKKWTGLKVTARTDGNAYCTSYTFTISLPKSEVKTKEQYIADKLKGLENNACYCEVERILYHWGGFYCGDEYISEKDFLEADESERLTMYKGFYEYLYNRELDNSNLYAYSEKYELTNIITPELINKLKRIDVIVASYNYDESNGQVDYFDCGFYKDYYYKVA